MKEKKKILILTQHYHPEPNFITKDLAEFFANINYEVKVITGHPNYPYGKYYSSVKSIMPKITNENNVKILRLPFYLNHDLSKFKRFFSYISFLIMTIIFSPFFCLKTDYVIVYQTPFTMGIASFIYKFLFRSKIIYVSADLWPESFSASNINLNSYSNKILYFYSRWINNFANIIICSTKGMINRYQNDGQPLKKLVYIPLWTEKVNLINHKEKIIEKFKNISSEDKKLKIVYAGNIGPAQQISVLLEAAEILKNYDSNIEFHIYGIGSEYEVLLEKNKELNLKNVFFWGRVTPQEVLDISFKADIQFIHIRSTPLFKMTVPSKFIFCTSVGTPIICGLEGEARQLATESNGALIFEPNNPEDLAKKIVEFMSYTIEDKTTMSLNLLKYYEANFNPKELLNKYKNTLESMN